MDSAGPVAWPGNTSRRLERLVRTLAGTKIVQFAQDLGVAAEHPGDEYAEEDDDHGFGNYECCHLACLMCTVRQHTAPSALR